jgi:hypothetical protein
MFVQWSRSSAAGLAGIMKKCRPLYQRACDPYRPERHYMRGPGPKCLARQQSAFLETIRYEFWTTSDSPKLRTWRRALIERPS